MKKVLLLMVAFISVMVMGCSDSDDKFQAGIVGYETFLNAKNAWKEPTSYSYTVHIGAWKPDAFVIDVKVTKGVSTFSLNPDYKYYSSSDTPESVCKEIESRSWNIKTMTEIFESVEKRHKDSLTNPAYQAEYDYYLIVVSYDKSNNLYYPRYVDVKKRRKDFDKVGDSYDNLTITDFKVLEE